MKSEPRTTASELKAVREGKPDLADENNADTFDPNDSILLRDQVKGQTTEHASPSRLEDEGQSGG
jgi:hypothetical protein